MVKEQLLDIFLIENKAILSLDFDITEGPFVAYSSPNFEGQRVTLLPGNYPDGRYLPGDNRLSSVRPGIALE